MERPREKVPIPGTDGWLRVTTTHGNVFYAQKKTKRSEWTVPDEIREQVEVMESVEVPPSKRVRTETREDEHRPAAVEPVAMVSGTEAPDAAEALVSRTPPSPARAPAPASPPASAPTPAPAPAPAPAPPVGVPATSLSYEEGRALFMNMLSSLNGTAHEVNPMAPWDRELPKFVHMPAYSALPSTRDREEVFNEWCKLRLREKRARKTQEPKAASDASTDERALYALYRKKVVSTRTSFDEVQRQWGTDPHFRAVGETRARTLFAAWMQELGEIKTRLAKKADTAFLALLSERLVSPQRVCAEAGKAVTTKEDALAVWTTAKKTPGLVQDKRYDAVGSATKRAALFSQWVQGEALDERAEQHAPEETTPEAPQKAPTDARSDAARKERALRQREEQVRRASARTQDRNDAARHDVVSEHR